MAVLPRRATGRFKWQIRIPLFILAIIRPKRLRKLMRDIAHAEDKLLSYSEKNSQKVANRKWIRSMIFAAATGSE